MHRHGSPLIHSLSRCLKESASHVRHRTGAAGKPRGLNEAGLWASQFPPDVRKPPHPWPTKRKPVGKDRKGKAPVEERTPTPEELTPYLMEQPGRVRTATPKQALLRSEETRLRDVINLAGTPKQMSADKQAFFEGQSAESASPDDEFASFLEIAPGSLVETRRNDTVVVGIVVGESTHLNIRHFVTMTPAGECWEHRPSDVTFVIPSCVPMGLAQRCGIEEIPADDNQLHARMEVLKRLREQVRSLEDKFNQMRRSGNEIYAKLKAPNSEEWGEATVAEVAHMLEVHPSIGTIYATHCFMMKNSLHFVARNPYIMTQKFDVRPAADVAAIEQVLDWKRSGHEALTNFAAKAKPLLEKNKATQKESALEEPQVFKGKAKWEPTDTTILDFLLKSLRQTRSTQSDPYAIGQIAIMRLLYPDLPQIEQTHVYDVLVGLGVVAPWQDLFILDKNVHILEEPEPHPGTRRAKEEERIVKASFANISQTPPQGPLGPEDLYPTDPLESVRRDWGTLRAYVIDDATAKELDDAVSVEPLEKEKGCYWLHVHIANPTAVLPPTHALAKRALREGSTEYGMHRTVPLFPESLTHHPQYGWSLGSTLETGQPARVLTFSAKVNEDGEILDYAVRAGLLKDIRVLSYEFVDKVLGYEAPQHLPFGDLGSKERAPERQSESNERKDLRLLEKIAEGFRKRRVRDEVLVQARYFNEIAFGGFPKGTMTPNLKTLQEFKGFLELTKYKTFHPDVMEQGSHGLVAEAMKIASRVASRFALQHDTEMIRRAVGAPVFADEAKRQQALALRSEGSTSISIQDFVPLVDSLPAGEYTLEPKAHCAVGVPEGEGYVRVTSPLRRSLDLVSHWQLHHALLRGKEPNPRPMFEREWLEGYKTTFAALERQTKLRDRNSRLFWNVMAFKKWLAGDLRGVTRPPQDVFEGVVTEQGRINHNNRDIGHEVTLEEFAIRGALRVPKLLAPGERIQVRVKEAKLGIRPAIEFELA
ncbi:ribonuclease II [Coprinopsis sp. MPI-PUGE-AT-0042]|nr:ribonuclease II [Coprinopsis sp. MPI-PUGE-AT-0042]